MTTFLKRKQLFTLTKRHLQTTLERMKVFNEISIPVPWGKIAGKWWGPSESKPILCLHGYQDNCGTFDRLIPFLSKDKNISFLAIDLPGHGYSSPLPKGMFYHFLYYVILLEQINDYFKWPTVSLMGHSLGAIVSFCYTILYPEKVNFLICIDAMNPIETPLSANSLKASIERFKKYDKYNRISEEPVSYTMEQIIEKVTSAFNHSITPEAAPFLLERKIAASKKSPGKYYFTRDPVLKARISFEWPHQQIMESVSSITHPIFVCKSKQMAYFGSKDNFDSLLNELRKSSRDCDFHILEGTHHLHLNEPENIGARIERFLEKHHIPEKSNLDHNSALFCESPPSPLKIHSKL